MFIFYTKHSTQTCSSEAWSRGHTAMLEVHVVLLSQRDAALRPRPQDGFVNQISVLAVRLFEALVAHGLHSVEGR